MRDVWQQRIDRAAHLAERDATAGPFMRLYGQLLAFQRDCYETLRQCAHFTGSLESDLGAVRPCVAPMLSALRAIGPPRLAEEADRILAGGATAIDAMLLNGWRSPARQRFFPKIALQPYAQYLAAIDLRPSDRDMRRGKYSCAFCGGAPQLSFLESQGAADGGSRQLMCATCFTAWPLARVRCAHCGEEDERRLCYYHSPAFDHLRVDACDTCKHYLKTVDLTRMGIAVPVVDEVAGATLDLWAVDHGYQKIELNLMGL